MKITKRIKAEPKKAEPPKLSEDLETGTIFRYENNVIGLKLEDGCVLLKYTSGNDWLATEGLYENVSIAEVLGKIDEIIYTDEV